jgi:hypothetical protein
MARIGELLVHAGLVTQAQVDEALRSQVVWGGRLGTNLIELESVDLDDLALWLGRQHQMPAALRRHFEGADPELQARVPPAMAAAWGVIPIARLSTDDQQIAIACLGPLREEGANAIARCFDVEPGRLVAAVAAELRILYNLERVYGVQRPGRFLRVKRGSTGSIVAIPPPPADTGSGDDFLAIASPEDFESEVPSAVGRSDQTLDVAAVAPADRADTDDETSPERRRFVRTLADSEPPATAAAAPAPVFEASLGRISLRKLSTVASPLPSGIGDSLRAIKRARNRDQVAELAVDALDRHAGADVDAVALFLVRGAVALGWRGFSRDLAVSFDRLAVPVDEHGVVINRGQDPRCLVVEQCDLRDVDRKMIGALSPHPPTYLVVAPVVIVDRNVCFVYAQGRTDQAHAHEVVVAVADATRAGLIQLLRASRR